MQKGDKHTQETKNRISLSMKGKKFTIEHKKNLQIAQDKRRVKYALSEDDFRQAKLLSYMCLRIDRVIKFSGNDNPAKRPEVREKMSISAKKHPPNALGVKRSDETKEKLSSIAKMRQHTDETKEKIGKSSIGRIPWNIGLFGNASPAWKGGLSFEPYCPKWNNDLKERIRAFFDYKCIICNKSTEENGRQLACHHVEYNKQACCDGKIVHFAALCNSCHTRTNSDRDRWEYILHRIIDEIYLGKSYYTKEEWTYIHSEVFKSYAE